MPYPCVYMYIHRHFHSASVRLPHPIQRASITVTFFVISYIISPSSCGEANTAYCAINSLVHLRTGRSNEDRRRGRRRQRATTTNQPPHDEGWKYCGNITQGLMYYSYQSDSQTHTHAHTPTIYIVELGNCGWFEIVYARPHAFVY